MERIPRTAWQSEGPGKPAGGKSELLPVQPGSPNESIQNHDSGALHSFSGSSCPTCPAGSSDRTTTGYRGTSTPEQDAELIPSAIKKSTLFDIGHSETVPGTFAKCSILPTLTDSFNKLSVYVRGTVLGVRIQRQAT